MQITTRTSICDMCESSATIEPGCAKAENWHQINMEGEDKDLCQACFKKLKEGFIK